MSLAVFLRMACLYLVPYLLVYILCYVIWSIHFGYNHPIPYLGAIPTVATWIVFPLGLWFLLPADLLAKEDFRRKLRVYMIYCLWCIILLFQHELLTYAFYNIPSKFQFLSVFMIAVCREFDFRMRSKLVDKMMGDPDEPGIALNAITFTTLWAIFIAVRLADAEFSTLCVVLAIDFALHLKFTIEIIEEHKKIAVEGAETGRTGRSTSIITLVFSELVEGFVPIVYGICMAMAYCGPNSHLFVNIGSDFWGQKIEDIGAIFYLMSIVLTFDTASVVVTSICIRKMASINIFHEFEELLGKYWLVMGIKLAYLMSTYFGATDVNFGTDASSKWITEEGRLSLINITSYLTEEEKSILLANTTLI